MVRPTMLVSIPWGAYDRGIMTAKRVSVVVVGDEILSGRVVDTNGPHLAARLRDLGAELCRIEVVGDDVAVIAETVSRLSPGHDWVITSGGVGPTHDDVTMEGVAKGLGRELVVESRIVELVRKWRGEVDEAGLHMARLPAGARLREVDGHLPVVIVGNVIVLPGVPRLLQSKFELITDLFLGDEQPKTTRIFRLERSELAEAGRISHLAEHIGPKVALGSYPIRLRGDHPMLELTLTSRDTRALDRAVEDLVTAFPDAVERRTGDGQAGNRQEGDAREAATTGDDRRAPEQKRAEEG